VLNTRSPQFAGFLTATSGLLDRNQPLRFRDRLRASGPLRDEYATVKRELARRLGDDRAAYSEAKSAFIRRLDADTRDEE
jgi:GrpB-like predicted nucleotidyltransferase (UPF0157 family)